MRLKTVVRLGTIISVLLFCMAVGYYAFMQLDMANRNRKVDLLSLVPSDCSGVLESDNISTYLNDLSELNYGLELERFQFPGLFSFILGGLNEYTAQNAHGLSHQMNRLLVSFHQPCGPRDQVIYFQLGTADETLLADMLQEYTSVYFLPKEEMYRGKKITIYPLNHEEYLSTYAETGFLVVSYQKKLIENVIDAKLDGTSLGNDSVFSQVSKDKKTNYLTLYTHSVPMPLLGGSGDCWSEYDFHLNSDVLYLTGESYLSMEGEVKELFQDRIKDIPLERNECLFLSADKDSTQCYIEKAYEANLSDKQILFDECVANLSNEAAVSLVADMQCLDGHLLKPYLPTFILDNTSLLSSFILSAQYSLIDDRLSHIWVFTYKD